MKKNFKFYWEEPIEAIQKQPGRRQHEVKELRIEVPGYSKNEIRASLTRNSITISASKHQHDVRRGQGFYHEQQSTNSFSRSVSLPSVIDPAHFEVVIGDGTVSIRKKTAKS